jgi:hypothetical protein
MQGRLPTSRRIKGPRCSEEGFSLVEVVVAGCILGLTVSALTVMIGNSDLLRSTNEHNRQARIIAQEELEDPKHHFFAYTKMEGLAAPISLDYGENGVNKIAATREVSVSAEKLSGDIFGDGTKIPYKLVSSKVTWSESGADHKVELEKRIVEVP